MSSVALWRVYIPYICTTHTKYKPYCETLRSYSSTTNDSSCCAYKSQDNPPHISPLILQTVERLGDSSERNAVIRRKEAACAHLSSFISHLNISKTLSDTMLWEHAVLAVRFEQICNKCFHFFYTLCSLKQWNKTCRKPDLEDLQYCVIILVLSYFYINTANKSRKPIRQDCEEKRSNRCSQSNSKSSMTISFAFRDLYLHVHVQGSGNRRVIMKIQVGPSVCALTNKTEEHEILSYRRCVYPETQKNVFFKLISAFCVWGCFPHF